MVDMVKFSKGLTINLGNYNSLRLDYGVEFERTCHGYDGDFDSAKRLVDETIDAQLDEHVRDALEKIRRVKK